MYVECLIADDTASDRKGWGQNARNLSSSSYLPFVHFRHRKIRDATSND
jgi:hypothetical protein